MWPPASVSVSWARDDATRAAIGEAHRVAVGVADMRAWVEDHAIVVYSGARGTKRERPTGRGVQSRLPLPRMAQNLCRSE